MNYKIIEKNWKYNFQNEKWEIISKTWFDKAYYFENDFAIVEIKWIFKIIFDKFENILWKNSFLDWLLLIFLLLVIFSPFFFITEKIIWISLPNSDYDVWFINKTISGILFIVYFIYFIYFSYKIGKSYYFIDKNWNIINKKPFSNTHFNEYFQL